MFVFATYHAYVNSKYNTLTNLHYLNTYVFSFFQGMKVSCTHFQCAAGAFQSLKDHYGANLTPDMNGDLLSFQVNLLLVGS